MYQFVCPPMPHFIVCGEDTYPAGGVHPDRSPIGVFDLLAVTRGALYLEEQGETYQVGAGEFLILRPDRSHRTAEPCGTETHFYWLHFQTRGEWADTAERVAALPVAGGNVYRQEEPFLFALPRTGAVQAADVLPDRLRMLLALQQDTSAAARWRAQSAFHDLLLQLQEESGGGGAEPFRVVADEAAAYLRRRYREAVNYGELAEALHFHPNYIALCMKRAFGCTPLEYVTRFRVDMAKQLLVRTNEPVGAVAEQCGFGSFPYFTRCFNRHTGVTPKAFRQRYRGAGREG